MNLNRIQQRPTEDRRYDTGPDVGGFALALAIVLAGMMVLGAGRAFGQAPGRFVLQFDGNYYDRDDWGSAAAAAAVVNDANGERLRPLRLEAVYINDHIPQSSSTWASQMKTSASRFPCRVVNCAGNFGGAAADLRALFMTARSGDPIWVGQCGTSDLTYQALVGVPASTRRYITNVSHSSRYNEGGRNDEGGGGVRSLAECTGIVKISIPNGNAALNTKQNWAPWAWERTVDPFAYGRMRESGRADISDLTVTGFLVYGDRQTSISDYRGWISQ
jgi:hypothetical protein